MMELNVNITDHTEAQFAEHSVLVTLLFWLLPNAVRLHLMATICTRMHAFTSTTALIFRAEALTLFTVLCS